MSMHPSTVARLRAPHRPLIAGLALLAIMLVTPAFAQETTSALRGTVINQAGEPVANAPVRITDQRTGSTRTTRTGANGTFAAAGLRVGGPYSVEVSAGTYARQTVNEITLRLGDTYNFSLRLQDSSVEEVVVTGEIVRTAATALGPSSSYSLQDMQLAPAINRDIKDLIRIDPRIYIDEADVDSIQCAGANSRFNSLTLDGVRLNDNFGLNRNGYPTENIPFSYDSIEQIAVELAPFDVQYGGFTACNINAVTKSGSNEFHGNMFVDYTDDSLTGDKLQGDNINIGKFDETRYGVSLGGPLIKDRLWFFAAYEKKDGANTFDRGAAGSGAAREVTGVAQAQLDEIRSIAVDLYGYDPGAVVASIPNEDEKLLVKLDWDINDFHRAALTYNYNDGFNISRADGDNDELEFSNHYFERGAKLTAYSGQLYSNWTEQFSTELRVAYSELDNRQLPLGGVDFGEVQIATFNDPDNDGVFSRATVYLGADDSRHANKLYYENTGYKLKGTYLAGSHTISAGWERDEFDVFNLFIQEAEGEYRFTNANPGNPNGGIDAFRAGRPDRVTYENAAPSNVKNDAGALFGYAIDTLYVQDEFPLTNADVTIVAGLRYDRYSSGDVPNANPNFLARYGFSNQQNLDGADLLQPRIGFNWDVSAALSVRGGIGLYSGGNPNVWLSNNYSNNGITQVEVQDRSLDDADNPDTLFTIPHSGGGRPLYDIPQALFDAVASGSADSGVNALDPDFEIPSDWKLALGATYDFDLPGGLGEGYVLSLDALVSKQNDAAIVRDISLVQVGTAPDGRPIYRGIDRMDPDCADPLSPACSGRTQDFLLTNVRGSEGGQKSYSVALSKSYDNGIDWTFGYAYTESDDVSPMTSSVAFSNFANVAVSDPNNPGRAQSNYEIPNRLTLRVSFQRALFGDNMTNITLFGSANEGRPYTYTFSDGFAFGDSAGFIDRQLVYVPTGPNDPLVDFQWSAAESAAYFAFAQQSGLNQYAGQILPRNALHSDWWTKFDLKIEQELPGFTAGHKFAGFLVVENLGNLLNDDWGILREAGSPRYQSIINSSINSNGQYVYSNFFAPEGQSRETDASSWEMRFGFKYSF